jgi:thioredoxin reductase (NADPH)
MLTTDVENYPGFPSGILGPELMDVFKNQSERFGTRVISDDVTAVDFSVRPFVVHTTDETYRADAVIIATGASAMWLGVPGEKDYQGHGVSACATCDGFFFKGKEVLVVGGGDSAMEEATFLTKFASKVTVVVRKDALRASKIMQERARNNPKITFLWNTEVKEVLGDPSPHSIPQGRPEGTRRATGSRQVGKMTGVKILNNQTNEEQTFAADGLFVAIGHKPNTEIFAGQIELDQKRYIVVQSGSTKTNVEGVFAAGDVVDHVYRQAVTAAGTGCMAALDAERWLAGHE